MSDNGESILDQVFSTPEEEVKTFMEVIKESVSEHDDNASGDGLEEIINGKVAQINPADLLTQQSGWVQIGHGWHGEDYVWHICPSHAKKSWACENDTVCFAVAKTMNTVIPQDIEVKIWLPYSDWDVKEITFKAIDLKSCWNVTDKEIRKMTIKLFEVLNALF